MSVKIHCPNCGRILGDTNKSIDGLKLNCRGCKETVTINLRMTDFHDYYLDKLIKERNNKNDKSK